MAFCPSCGTPVVGSPSCPKCGAPTGAAPAPVSMPSPAVPYSSVPVGPRLPDVSPLAIILALVSWVFTGIFTALPAMFIARSDIRGCREGRYNPAGLTQSQLAFWIAAINVLLTALACLAALVFIIFIGGVAGFAASSMAKMEEESRKAQVEFTQQNYADVEKVIEGHMSARSKKDQENWTRVKKEWEALRKKGKVSGDPLPDSKSMNALLEASAMNIRLWSALKVAEEKVAAELGYAPPARFRSSLPAESTGTHTDDD